MKGKLSVEPGLAGTIYVSYWSIWVPVWALAAACSFLQIQILGNTDNGSKLPARARPAAGTHTGTQLLASGSVQGLAGVLGCEPVNGAANSLSLFICLSHFKKGQLLFMQKMSAISEKFFSPNTFFMNFKKSVVLGRAGVGRGRETCLPSVYSSDVCGGPGPGNSQEPCIPLGSPWWVAGTGYALAGSRICSECGTQTCDRDALSQVAP